MGARALFRAQIQTQRGRVVDMAGDSLLAVFGTAHGAVPAALAIQGQINALAEGGSAGRRMLFRVGVHSPHRPGRQGRFPPVGRNGLVEHLSRCVDAANLQRRARQSCWTPGCRAISHGRRFELGRRRKIHAAGRRRQVSMAAHGAGAVRAPPRSTTAGRRRNEGRRAAALLQLRPWAARRRPASVLSGRPPACLRPRPCPSRTGFHATSCAERTPEKRPAE